MNNKKHVEFVNYKESLVKAPIQKQIFSKYSSIIANTFSEQLTTPVTRNKVIQSNPNLKKWDVKKLLILNNRNISGENLRLKLRKESKSSNNIYNKLNSQLTSENNKLFKLENKEIVRLHNYGKELIRQLSSSLKIHNKLDTIIKLNRKSTFNKYKTNDIILDTNNNILQQVRFNEKGSEQWTNFENNYSNLSNEENKESSQSNFIIFHENIFRKSWDLCVFLTSLYTIIFSPVGLVFFDNYIIKLIEAILECICLIDIVLNFITTFFNEEETLVTNLYDLILSYLFSWFFCDLLGCIPFDLIYLFTGINSLPFIKWSKILRGFKIYREDSTGRFIKQLEMNECCMMNRVFKFVLIFIHLLHISSCFFIYLALNSNNSNNWIVTSDLSSNIFDIYIASLYFNLVTVFSIGYGDIIPVNLAEKIWVNFFMIAGSMLYSYFISSLSTIFFEENKQYVEYKKRCAVLDSINEECGLNNQLYNKIDKTIKEDYKKNENERWEFLESLPSNIKNELVTVMYESTIVQNQFFKNKHKSFVLYVLPMLKYHRVHKKEVLVSVGDVIEEMYFVLKGKLSLTLGVHYKNTEVCQIKSKNYFGDLFMQLNEHSPYDLRCRSKCADLLVLKKSDYLKIKTNCYKEIFQILDFSIKQFELIDKKREFLAKVMSFCPNFRLDVKKEPKLDMSYINNEINFAKEWKKTEISKDKNDNIDYPQREIFIKNIKESSENVVSRQSMKETGESNYIFNKNELKENDKNGSSYQLLTNQTLLFKQSSQSKSLNYVDKEDSQIFQEGNRTNNNKFKKSFNFLLNEINKSHNIESRNLEICKRDRILSEKTLKMFSKNKVKSVNLTRRSIYCGKSGANLQTKPPISASDNILCENCLLYINRNKHLKVQNSISFQIRNESANSIRSIDYFNSEINEENEVVSNVKKGSHAEKDINCKGNDTNELKHEITFKRRESELQLQKESIDVNIFIRLKKIFEMLNRVIK